MTEPVNGRSDEKVILEVAASDYRALTRAIQGERPFSDLNVKVIGRNPEDERAIGEAMRQSDDAATRELLDGRTFEVRQVPDTQVELRREDFDRLTDALEPRERSVSMSLPTGMPSQYGRAEAMKQFSRAVVPQDKKGRMQVSGTVVLDSAQLRYINGTSQRMGLAYVLDTRLNTLLDSGGLHMLSVESVYRDNDGEAIVKAYTYIKLAYIVEPVNVWLAVRIRDWMQLQPAKKDHFLTPEEQRENSRALQNSRRAHSPDEDITHFNLTLGDIAPDDRTVWGNP